MDPNTALRRLRHHMAMYRAANTSADAAEAGGMIHEYAAALDEWLSRGGFLPEAWARARAEGEPAPVEVPF